MGIKEERNARISAYLERLYSMATDESFQIDESEYKSDMDKLFTTTAWGFREILLVVAVGMELDNAFRASTGFYDCNPRAIYEGPIKEFFIGEGNHILIDFPPMVSNQQVQLQMDAYHKVTEQQIPMTAATILYKSVFT